MARERRVVALHGGHLPAPGCAGTAAAEGPGRLVQEAGHTHGVLGQGGSHSLRPLQGGRGAVRLRLHHGRELRAPLRAAPAGGKRSGQGTAVRGPAATTQPDRDRARNAAIPPASPGRTTGTATRTGDRASRCCSMPPGRSGWSSTTAPSTGTTPPSAFPSASSLTSWARFPIPRSCANTRATRSSSTSTPSSTHRPCSRARVFELLACDAAVISTESAGIERIFGDLVPVVTTMEEATAALTRLIGDDDHRRETVTRARRLVMTEHTYRQRLALIAQTMGYSVSPDLGDGIAALALIDDAEQARKVSDLVAAISSQRSVPAELLIGLGLDMSVAGDLHQLSHAGSDVRVQIVQQDHDGRATSTVQRARRACLISLGGDSRSGARLRRVPLHGPARLHALHRGGRDWERRVRRDLGGGPGQGKPGAPVRRLRASTLGDRTAQAGRQPRLARPHARRGRDPARLVAPGRSLLLGERDQLPGRSRPGLAASGHGHHPARPSPARPCPSRRPAFATGCMLPSTPRST